MITLCKKVGTVFYPVYSLSTPLHICVMQNEIRVIFQTDTVATKLCVASLQFIFSFIFKKSLPDCIISKISHQHIYITTFIFLN